MFVRILRSSGEASSLISPVGRIARRIRPSTSRKSITDSACAASSGTLSSSSRNCWRSHDAVSSSDAASRNAPASKTAPGPPIFVSQFSGSASAPNPKSFPARSHSRPSRISANPFSNCTRSRENCSASSARLPGAHVDRPRSNSRSFSNSRISSAVRDIILSSESFHQMRNRARARRGDVYDSPVRFAPRRGMSQLYSPHAIQHRYQEIPEHRKRFPFYHRFVHHLPHNRQLHKRSRAAFASDKAIAQPNQFKQPLLPRLHPHFHVNPRVRLRLKKFRRYTVRLPAGFFRATRNRFHHSAVSAAAHRESRSSQFPAQQARI